MTPRALLLAGFTLATTIGGYWLRLKFSGSHQ